MRPDLTVLADPAALAAAAADSIVTRLSEALRLRERAHLALAGGSTPRAMNALLATLPRRERVDWDRVTFWFGDERCVPPDDPQSNYRMNRETLLDPLGIAPEHVRRMHGEDPPLDAAAAYDESLRVELGEVPTFDLILLGMGPDGHTASLFPGTIADIDPDRRCIAHAVPQLGAWRITLTPRTINAARAVTITAGGAEKAAALAAVLDGPRLPDRYPSQLIAPRNGSLDWLVDAAAAGAPNRTEPGSAER